MLQTASTKSFLKSRFGNLKAPISSGSISQSAVSQMMSLMSESRAELILVFLTEQVLNLPQAHSSADSA